MKAVFEQIQAGRGRSLLLKKISLPAFDAPFHFHPEYELTYIVKGQGMRYVGMGAKPFGPGDLVLLGPNLPHCWINRPDGEGANVEAWVIQFEASFLKGALSDWPEFEAVKRLIDQSRGGAVFVSPPNHDQFVTMEEASPPKRLIYFLDLLQHLAETPYRTLIATDAIYEDQQRFRLVFGYIIGHYREKIELDTVAALVGLTPTSFCRYIKKMTGKTLFEIVLHYRLEASAQLLIGTSQPVNEIAFESGFENVSYFNRSFKKWKGLSPKEFRNSQFV